MPFLESNIIKVLRATGGARGGMTADELSKVVFAPIGRVRMTLRRLHDRGVVQVTAGHGADARYLPTGMRTSDPGPPRHTGNRHTADPEVHRLRAEVQQLQAELSRARHDADSLRELLRRRPSALHTDPARTLGPRIELLLQLCHPDRHDNSDKANEVTRWLLELRSKR